jgi:hypothetical protein
MLVAREPVSQPHFNGTTRETESIFDGAYAVAPGMHTR